MSRAAFTVPKKDGILPARSVHLKLNEYLLAESSALVEFLLPL